MSTPILPSLTAAAAELARYTTRVTSVARGARVEILRDGVPVGDYERNYGTLYDTFHPFIGPDGGTYALYSRDYTATRVMTLPSCADLGGEEPAGEGFCPVAYLVPYDPVRGLDGSIGFVAGCYWGDDTSWKVQFLDLAGAAGGGLVRDDRFGYLALPDHMRLAEAVDVSHWDIDHRSVRIQASHRFTIALCAGEQDRSVIVDERPPAPDLSIPEPLIPGPFDSFHAQFFDADAHWLTSQDVPTFTAAFGIAAHWARERERQIRVWGKSARGRTLLCYLEPDGSVEMRTG